MGWYVFHSEGLIFITDTCVSQSSTWFWSSFHTYWFWDTIRDLTPPSPTLVSSTQPLTHRHTFHSPLHPDSFSVVIVQSNRLPVHVYQTDLVIWLCFQKCVCWKMYTDIFILCVLAFANVLVCSENVHDSWISESDQSNKLLVHAS